MSSSVAAWRVLAGVGLERRHAGLAHVGRQRSVGRIDGALRCRMVLDGDDLGGVRLVARVVLDVVDLRQCGGDVEALPDRQAGGVVGQVLAEDEAADANDRDQDQEPELTDDAPDRARAALFMGGWHLAGLVRRLSCLAGRRLTGVGRLVGIGRLGRVRRLAGRLAGVRRLVRVRRLAGRLAGVRRLVRVRRLAGRLAGAGRGGVGILHAGNRSRRAACDQPDCVVCGGGASGGTGVNRPRWRGSMR